MSQLKQIDSPNAPAAIGAYSQAIEVGGLIFTSGALGLNPATKALPEGVKEQAEQALKNLRAILQAAGSDLDKVVKATVFLADIKDFPAVNEVYMGFFGKPFPARSCFAVAALPMAAKVEIEVIAAK